MNGPDGKSTRAGRRAALLAMVLAAFLLLAGCASPRRSATQAGNPSAPYPGLDAARSQAQAAAQADAGSPPPASDAPTPSPSSSSAPPPPDAGNDPSAGDVPALKVGQSWAGTVDGQNTVQERWTVEAVDQLALDGQTVYAYRLHRTAGDMTGTLWLRTSDLATLKSAWDEASGPSQPYAPGTVMESMPPCAMHWPVHDGDAWHSACTLRSWTSDHPDVIANASQAIDWTVGTADGPLVLHGTGTLTYPDRPDLTEHFTQDISVAGGACDPLRWEHATSSGAQERLDATC